MKRLGKWPLFAVVMVTCVLSASVMAMGCGAAAGQTPIEHPALVECGEPMGAELAKRVATLAVHQVQGGVSAEQLEKDIARELQNLAKDYGPGLVSCLVDKALNAYRTQSAALPASHRAAAPWRTKDLVAGTGFVPIERDYVHERPWHTLLAGARGVRS